MAITILIDNENLCFLKSTHSARAAFYWADILAAAVDHSIVGTENREFSKYTHYELRQLYYNTMGEHAPEDIAYSKLIKGVAELARGLIVDETTEDELHQRLGREPKPIDPKPITDGKRKKKDSGSGFQKINRPREGSTTAKIWDIADALYQELDEIPSRPQVIERAESAGINSSTASTQYGKWKKHLTQPKQDQ